MKNAIRKATRWMFVSAPGVGVLVISAGLGIGYAATNGDSATTSRQAAPRADSGFLVGPDQNLSASERVALEKFRGCMHDNVTPPGNGVGKPPDPGELRKQIDAAFEKCKGELPANLRSQFEQRQQQMDAFQGCMRANGAKPPSAGGKPSQSDLDAMQKAQKACADKLPSGGAAICAGVGPGGPEGPGGPPGLRSAGPPPFGPPPSVSKGNSHSSGK